MYVQYMFDVQDKAACLGHPMSWSMSCRHDAQLRRRAYGPTTNTASHDNLKNPSMVSLSFLYEYGAPLGGSSAVNNGKTLIYRNLKLIHNVKRLLVLIFVFGFRENDQ